MCVLVRIGLHGEEGVGGRTRLYVAEIPTGYVVDHDMHYSASGAGRPYEPGHS